MKKNVILDLISRKLTPYMILFGFYLLTYGHISPGGGFQGGVVIASGIILLSISRGVDTTERHFSVSSLSLTESVCFLLLVSAGLIGIAVGNGFLGSFIAPGAPAPSPRLSMMLVLNILVGLKVGAGISLVCIRLFRED